MIAKVIAWGRDRSEARARLSRALRQTAAVIDGGTTNKAFLLDLLDRPEILSGETDTTWLDTMMAAGYAPPRRLDVALLATAVEAQNAHVARQRERLFASAERGRPEVGHEAWHQVDVGAAGQSYRLRVAQSRRSRYRVELDGQVVDVDAERTGRFERKLVVSGQTFAVLSVPQGSDYLVEVDGAVHRISGGEAGLVRAPAPAMVVSIPVTDGDAVEAGDVVAVVESMKLETALRAPVTGRVREVLVAPNTQVEGGTKLVRIEPDDDSDAVEESERADLSALTGPAAADAEPTATAGDVLMSLQFLVLGYDIDERDARPLLGALAEARDQLAPDDARVLAGETAVLRIFADLCSLSRNRRGPEDETQQIDPAGEEARNPQEYLYAYLASRDADAEGLPESFREKLRRALAHYGVPDLEPSDRPEQRPLPDVPRAPAGVRARAGGAGAAAVAAAPPRLAARRPRARSTSARSTSSSRPPSCATRSSAASPGGCATPSSTRRSSTPSGRPARTRCGPSSTSSPTTPTRARRRSTRSCRRPSRSWGCSRSAHHAAMLEVMTRRYYRIRTLTDARARPTAAGARCSLRPTGTTGWTTSCWPRRCTPPRTRPPPATRWPCRATCAGSSPGCRKVGPRCSTCTSSRGKRPTPTRSARRRRSAGCSAGSPTASRASPSPCAGPSATSARPGSPSSPARTASRWRTGRCAACTRWSPSGWGCGGCRTSS